MKIDQLKSILSEFGDNIKFDHDLKKNMYGKKIVVGMGAGSISSWMKKLPQLM